MADNLATALADGDDAKVTDAVVAKQHSAFYATPLQMGLNGHSMLRLMILPLILQMPCISSIIN